PQNDDILWRDVREKSVCARPVGESRIHFEDLKSDRTAEELILSDLAEVDRFTDQSLRAVRGATVGLDCPALRANRECHSLVRLGTPGGIANDSLEWSNRGVYKSPSLI